MIGFLTEGAVDGPVISDTYPLVRMIRRVFYHSTPSFKDVARIANNSNRARPRVYVLFYGTANEFHQLMNRKPLQFEHVARYLGMDKPARPYATLNEAKTAAEGPSCIIIAIDVAESMVCDLVSGTGFSLIS